VRTIKKLLTHLEMLGDEEKVVKTINVAAGIIMKVEDNTRKVLLIQRAAEDHWPLHFEFPRGKCDKTPNEEILPCLKREIKEETSLDIIPIKLLGKFEYLADGGTRKSICYNFLCKMVDPNQEVKLSKEHRTYKWITQIGEAELLVHPDQKKFIQQVLSTENPIISVSDNSFTKNNHVEESITNDYTELVINVRDAENSLVRLIDYIQKKSSPGHSFSVVVDPDDSEYKKSFYMDGDGAFFIKDIKKDGKLVKIKDDKLLEFLRKI